jgi:Zn-dependent protease
VIVALTIHEAAHAWTADARRSDRAAARPCLAQSARPHRSDRHDPAAAASRFSGLPILGWAKPVPVNISRLRHHRRDFMIVAAAGPISNFLQALVIAVVFRALYDPGDPDLLRRSLEERSRPTCCWRSST